jgi:hypothetical protein
VNGAGFPSRRPLFPGPLSPGESRAHHARRGVHLPVKGDAIGTNPPPGMVRPGDPGSQGTRGDHARTANSQGPNMAGPLQTFIYGAGGMKPRNMFSGFKQMSASDMAPTSTAGPLVANTTPPVAPIGGQPSMQQATPQTTRSGMGGIFGRIRNSQIPEMLQSFGAALMGTDAMNGLADRRLRQQAFDERMRAGKREEEADARTQAREAQTDHLAQMTREQREQAIALLPPELQPYARLDPEGVIRQWMRNHYPTPSRGGASTYDIPDDLEPF